MDGARILIAAALWIKAVNGGIKNKFKWNCSVLWTGIPYKMQGQRGFHTGLRHGEIPGGGETGFFSDQTNKSKPCTKIVYRGVPHDGETKGGR